MSFLGSVFTGTRAAGQVEQQGSTAANMPHVDDLDLDKRAMPAGAVVVPHQVASKHAPNSFINFRYFKHDLDPQLTLQTVREKKDFNPDVPRPLTRFPGGALKYTPEHVKTVRLRFSLPSDSLTHGDLCKLLRNESGSIEMYLRPGEFAKRLGLAPGRSRDVIPLAIRVLEAENSSSVRMKVDFQTPDVDFGLRRQESQWKSLGPAQTDCISNDDVGVVGIPAAHFGSLPEGESVMYELRAPENASYTSPYAAQWRRVNFKQLVDALASKRAAHVINTPSTDNKPDYTLRIPLAGLSSQPSDLAAWFLTQHFPEIHASAMAMAQAKQVDVVKLAGVTEVDLVQYLSVSENIALDVAHQLYNRYGPPACAVSMFLPRVCVQPQLGVRRGVADLERIAANDKRPVRLSVTLSLTCLVLEPAYSQPTDTATGGQPAERGDSDVVGFERAQFHAEHAIDRLAVNTR